MLLTEMLTTANYASYKHLHKVRRARQRLEGNLILLQETTPTTSHEECTISQYTVAITAEKEQHPNQEPGFTDIIKQKIGNEDTDHTKNSQHDFILAAKIQSKFHNNSVCFLLDIWQETGKF
jgi:hypothetical protein